MPISSTTVQKVLSGRYDMTVDEWQATKDKSRQDKVADAMRRIKQIDRERKATDI